MHLAHYVVLAGVAAVTECRSGSAVTGPGDGRLGSPRAHDRVVAVAIRDFAFAPAAITVRAGTTVRWTNRGPSAHTTTSDDGAWDSDTLRAPSGGGYGGGLGGEPAVWSFEYTFAQPGVYGYHCAIHPPPLYPGFVGSVTVTQ